MLFYSNELTWAVLYVYTTSHTGFWIWCNILQRYGKTWQTSQQHSLLGLIQPAFPPRNPGCLTGNRPKSPKASISQPPPSPQASLLPRKTSPGAFSLCFSQTSTYKQAIFSTTPHFKPPHSVLCPLPSFTSFSGLPLALKQSYIFIR